MKTTPASDTSPRRLRTDVRLVGLIALAAALAACGWVLVGCGEDAPTEGLAPNDVATTITTWLAAVNAADKEALGAVYAADMLVDDYLQSPPVRTEGHDAVVDMVAHWSEEGLKFAAAGPPIQLGDYVVQPIIYQDAQGVQIGQGAHVLALDEDGKLVHEWATGGFNEE